MATEDVIQGTNTDGNAAADETLGDSAYQQLLPEFMALQPNELIVINVDVPSVVTLVIGSLPEIRTLLADIQKVSPEINADLLEKVRLLALALSYAHARYLSTAAPSSELQQLADAGIALRETLLSDASALARRGLIDQGKLNELQGVIGFKNIAVDLTILASVLKDRWADIAGKCAVDPKELDEALRVAERIFTAVGLREQGAASIESATEMRLRVFTLLSRVYDTVRRAVSFVRWGNDDVDKIAPSLYSGRTRKRAGSDVTETPPIPPAPVPAPPAPATPPAGDGSAHTASTASSNSPTLLSEPFMR